MSRGLLSLSSNKAGYGLQHLPAVKRLYRRNAVKKNSEKKEANQYYREQYISAYIEARSNALAHQNSVSYSSLPFYNSSNRSTSLATAKGEPSRSFPEFGSWRNALPAP